MATLRCISLSPDSSSSTRRKSPRRWKMPSAKRPPLTQMETRFGPKYGTGLRVGLRCTVEIQKASGSFSKKLLLLREKVDRNIRPSRADPKMQSIWPENSTKACRADHSERPNASLDKSCLLSKTLNDGAPGGTFSSLLPRLNPRSTALGLVLLKASPI